MAHVSEFLLHVRVLLQLVGVQLLALASASSLLPVKAHPGRQQSMAQALGSLPCMWETWNCYWLWPGPFLTIWGHLRDEATDRKSPLVSPTTHTLSFK